MKITLLLISTFLLILTGCGGNKNSPIASTQDSEKISKIVIDRIGNELVTYPDIKVVSTVKLFETVISDLNETVNEINSEASGDREQLQSWIKSLKDANVDFKKDNILIYTFYENAICDYKEDRVLKDKKQIDITFIQTSKACTGASTIYYLAYKVSKDIEIVNIKAFEQESVIIDMK